MSMAKSGGAQNSQEQTEAGANERTGARYARSLQKKQHILIDNRDVLQYN